jgi:hypothetical protein
MRNIEKCIVKQKKKLKKKMKNSSERDKRRKGIE